jgi:drug/metabolite transporter (DMT)-like permease
MLHADTPSKRRTGILLGSLATISFSILDTAGKWLATHIPLIEIVWLRFAIAAVIALIVVLPKTPIQEFKKENLKIQLIRAIMMIAMTILNFAGLKYLQLAQANAILFSSPIIIALISSIFLKEKLSINIWIAILGGFFGVLVILDPFGTSFHPAMFYILGHATIFALFNLLTRKMAASSSPDVTIVYSTIFPTLILLPIVIPQWQAPTQWLYYLIFFITGLFVFLGHYLLAIAYRFAKPTTISPFFYQQILYMIFLGWLIFGQIPQLSVLFGAVIVVACGLYLLFKENGRGKNEAPQ